MSVSRAFRKEDDDKPDRPPARPIGDGPNYVTPAGLQALHAALERAREENDERNIAYYDGRIESAVVIDSSKSRPGVVSFGSMVTVRDERGKDVKLRIVGEDEADPMHGTISWSSPYAQALTDRKIGNRVVVQRPAGAATVTIVNVEHPR
jgi:transcription elongation factor GreB